MSMYQLHSSNRSLVEGPPSPSPTRSKKRKRSESEEDFNTPTKTRSRLVSLGLPTPDEPKGGRLPAEDAQTMGSKYALQSDNPVLVTAGTFVPDTETNKSQIYSQQMTPPSSVSPSALPDPPGLQEESPSRIRMSSRTNVPFAHLMLSMPYFLIQPPSSPLHITSLEASVLALRRILTLHTSNPASQALSSEQECYAWIMFAELGLKIINSLIPSHREEPPPGKTTGVSSTTSPEKPQSLKYLSIPSWAPNPGEIETAISRALRLADQVASLRPLRHNLTMIHAQLVYLQGNQKHAKVLLKRLLPLSTNTQPIPREKVWASYEAHLAITNQILNTPLSNSLIADVPAALSQLNALFMLANQYGDHTLVQLISVIRLTTLLQNYESSGSISSADVDSALQEAETILGLDGFDEQVSPPVTRPAVNGTEGAKALNSTPGGNATDGGDQLVAPFTGDVLAGGGTNVVANIKTPAFSFPTNPLGMNVYGADQQLPAENLEITAEEEGKKLIPPYLRYLRVQTLMAGVLWLTHSGESTRSSERLTLLHEMMDKLNDLSKSEGRASDNESGLIMIPLYSNPDRPLRIQATHPRVLYQLTFVISAIAKRDCLGRKPKRKVFAQEGLRISDGDDPRTGKGSESALLEGGSPFDFAPGLGLRDLRYTQQSIAHIRATAYYELVSACLIRSEFEEAEQHLSDLVSFIRATGATQPSQPSMWDQYASRITLLYGHLAHARGQSLRALQCYQMVCFLEEDEESMMWTMGKVGEIVLRIGAVAIRAEEHGGGNDTDGADDPKHDQQIWRSGEREQLVEAASGVVDKCLNGGLGEHIATVGRVIAASLSAEIVRAKQNLKSGLDLASKSRDNYLRLLVLIFTAGQYLYTHTDYALTILETCRQLASSLGAVTAPPVKESVPEDGRRSTRLAAVDDRPQYHVGHARAGLWIGQRFAEISKRRGASDKVAKQSAINMVFQKAVDAIELQAGKNAGSRIHAILDEFPLRVLSVHPSAVEPQGPTSTKAPAPWTSKSRTRIPASQTREEPSHWHARDSEESQGTSASYPPSSHVSEHDHRSKRSDTSYSRSSVSAHSQNKSVTSTASRRSTRARGQRRVIIESDDEETGHRAMSEDEFEASELEDSDADLQL